MVGHACAGFVRPLKLTEIPALAIFAANRGICPFYFLTLRGAYALVPHSSDEGEEAR
jgi:hypothetical protein